MCSSDLLNPSGVPDPELLKEKEEEITAKGFTTINTAAAKLICILEMYVAKRVIKIPGEKTLEPLLKEDSGIVVGDDLQIKEE